MSAAKYELPAIAGDFNGKDIVSVGQFERQDVDAVMREAEGMALMVQAEGRDDLLKDLVVANLFYEPSTRTFLSFEAAAKRLGAATIATQGVEYSSISKGETLEDTVRTVERYADIVDMRHPKSGAAAIAAEYTRIPIINGGDGKLEHPTQALTDVMTILHKLGTLEGHNITMVGDLKNGRTVHSLARMFGLYGAQVNYVSPKSLRMPSEIIDELGDKLKQYETTDLEDVLSQTDVLYVTRVQKERFKPEAGPFKALRAKRAYDRVKNAYIIDEAIMRSAPKDMILMHPLPRVNEISPGVDKDPRAAYFDQVESGMYVRMALLALISGRSILGSSAGMDQPQRRAITPWMMSESRA